MDGLANAANLELKYTLFRANGLMDPSGNPVKMKRLRELCEKAYDEKDRRTGSKSSANDRKHCQGGSIKPYLSAGEYREFLGSFWDFENQDRHIGGVTAKFGYQSFNYIDASTGAKAKQDETPWALGAFYAYNPNAWRSIFTLGFQYQHAFKEGDNGTVCPASGGAAVRCSTGALGKPTERNKKLLTAEARKDFVRAGVGLTFTRDFESHVWGLELPISFLKDKDGNYIGGVKAAWRSDNHVFGVGVFVGSTFGLLN